MKLARVVYREVITAEFLEEMEIKLIDQNRVDQARSKIYKSIDQKLIVK